VMKKIMTIRMKRIMKIRIINSKRTRFLLYI